MLTGSGDGVLACELGASVGAAWTGRVGLDVGRRGGAVEDIVGGHMHQERRGGGQVSGARPVDQGRLLLVLLGTVDVGPGGAVDHRVGPRGLDRGADRGGVGDVEVAAREGDDVVARGSAGSGDESRPRCPRPP